MPAKSWSLQARATCPGSIDKATKLPVAVCAGCYANEGFYMMPDAIKVREHNREDWKRAEWVDDMVKELKRQKFFRWFDSGDVYHPALAFKIFLVMQKTPHVKHWLPTKSYKVPRIRAILERMKTLDNVARRLSRSLIATRARLRFAMRMSALANVATVAPAGTRKSLLLRIRPTVVVWVVW
jgi:hypothetical protein